MRVAAIRRAERDLRQVDHRQHVGVGKLVLEREADEVEFVRGRARLERVEGNPLRPHELLHVAPRREAELGERVRALVHDVVEDLDPEIGHPDLVEIREAEERLRLDRVGILAGGMEEAARIPTRLGHDRQIGLIQNTQLIHASSSASTSRNSMHFLGLSWVQGVLPRFLPSVRIYHRVRSRANPGLGPVFRPGPARRGRPPGRESTRPRRPRGPGPPRGGCFRSWPCIHSRIRMHTPPSAGAGCFVFFAVCHDQRGPRPVCRWNYPN